MSCSSEGSCFVRWKMYQVKTDGCFIGETSEKRLRRDSEQVCLLQTEQSQTPQVCSEEQASTPPLKALRKSRLTLWLFGHFLWVSHVSSHHSVLLILHRAPGFRSPSLLCYSIAAATLNVFFYISVFLFHITSTPEGCCTHPFLELG